MRPLVSILIPCYNAAAWLEKTLESALGQTWPEKEIILVDDGSSDESLQIAARFESRGVQILSQGNRGASAARNRALRVAGGDYIQYLDADDLLHPSKIAVQMERLLSKPGVVASGEWGHFERDPSATVFTPEKVWCDLSPLEWLVCSWTGGGMMQPGAWLTPRAVALAAGPWDESLSLDDDGEYFARVLLASSGVCFVNQARVYYRRSGATQLSASRGRRAAESSFRSCQSKERVLLMRENSPRTRRAVASNYCRFAWEQLDTAPDLVRKAISRWKTLDPSVPPATGGKIQQAISRFIGWRSSRRLQLVAQRIRAHRQIQPANLRPSR